MISIQKSAKKTFAQRLGTTAIFWGIPVFFLELIGIPRQGRILIVFIELLVTTAGVFIYTLIEYGIVCFIKRHLIDDNACPK